MGIIGKNMEIIIINNTLKARMVKYKCIHVSIFTHLPNKSNERLSVGNSVTKLNTSNNLNQNKCETAAESESAEASIAAAT